MERRPRIHIVGAGIAGAASAWHLAKRGALVHLWEAADAPDAHSSGRNAAILRTAIPHAPLHALAAESVTFYRNPSTGFSPTPLIQPHGLVLAAAEGKEAEAQESWLQDSSCAPPSRELGAEEFQNLLPFAASSGLRGWWFQDEGTLDVHALHQAFLHGALAAGAELHLRQAVTKLHRHGNALQGFTLADGTTHQADAVVLATGGWGDALLRPLGIQQPLIPRRRHLFVTTPTALVPPTAPVLWILGEQEFYCRPESGGLLLSACDSEVVAAEEGEQLQSAQRDAAIEAALERLPGLADCGLAHGWAGMRTFRDRADFLVGPEPQLPGLHWAAGLGGHGMCTAYAVGRQVADGIMHELGESNLVDVPGFAGA
jgi:D-arginine dehydrogenase